MHPSLAHTIRTYAFLLFAHSILQFENVSKQLSGGIGRCCRKSIEVFRVASFSHEILNQVMCLSSQFN